MLKVDLFWSFTQLVSERFTDWCGVFSGGAGMDPHGRDMLDLPANASTTWIAGETARVGWAIDANHGGGYAFRMCPMNSSLAEDCFQSGHLNFANDIQQLIAPNGTVIAELNAIRTRIGTFPIGSAWTRNPVPMEDPNSRRGKDYVPIPGFPTIFGRGPFPFNIMDTIQVPTDIASGNYVVSWRWDAEQTKQVWSQCGDVIVVQKQDNITTKNDRFQSFRRLGARIPTTETLCVGKSLGLDIYDCQAWVELYDALNGEQWPKVWSENCVSLRTDPCGCGNDWEKHVQCTGRRGLQRISEIYLMDAHVQGVLPKSIGRFDALVALSLVGKDLRILRILFLVL